MSSYRQTSTNIWTGRISENQLYLHEVVVCADLEGKDIGSFENAVAFLGYACDDGVKRNQGRVGAFDGPDAIRKQLAKMPNHLGSKPQFVDAGSVQCLEGDMEKAQAVLANSVCRLLKNGAFPILLGGGHDIAYGHYNGLRKYLGKEKSIGIINFDAHFDLRNNENGNNSGTPFYQIAKDCEQQNEPFHYLALGIRKDANDQQLFKTAEAFGVDFIENIDFNIHDLENIGKRFHQFIDKVDNLYVTIDLDGFSSAYAPGVSAPSPMGFSPDIVLECLKLMIDSKKMIGLDLAEMNPKYDLDDQTAKLAASLVHFVMHQVGESF